MATADCYVTVTVFLVDVLSSGATTDVSLQPFCHKLSDFEWPLLFQQTN